MKIFRQVFFEFFGHHFISSGFDESELLGRKSEKWDMTMAVEITTWPRHCCGNQNMAGLLLWKPRHWPATDVVFVAWPATDVEKFAFVSQKWNISWSSWKQNSNNVKCKPQAITKNFDQITTVNGIWENLHYKPTNYSATRSRLIRAVHIGENVRIS